MERRGREYNVTHKREDKKEKNKTMYYTVYTLLTFIIIVTFFQI